MVRFAGRPDFPSDIGVALCLDEMWDLPLNASRAVYHGGVLEASQ